MSGLNLFNEEYAFFSKPLGVTILPVTNDGSVFVAKRENKDLYGYWNCVAGYVAFRTPRKNLGIKKDLIREVRHEIGIAKSSFIGEPKILALSHNLYNGETEISFLLNVNQPDEYFTSGEWKTRIKE